MNTITLDEPGDYLIWRDGSGGTVEIFDIAVTTERRKGRGRRLVRKLFARLKSDTVVYAITRADNEVAQYFYESLGFRTVNVLRRFYSGEKGVDAIMYLRRVREN